MGQPDVPAALDRYHDLQRRWEADTRIAWVGFLVTQFSNDELRAVADHISIGEVLTLRELGLLRPDEGFDGRKKPKRGARSGSSEAS
jgi:hypothetical protein